MQHWARAHGIRAYEVSVLDRDSLKEPFSYVAWRMSNPGQRACSDESLTIGTSGSSEKGGRSRGRGGNYMCLATFVT